jgi:hypothetical protein
MKTITSVQARVQSDPATWDTVKKEWVLVRRKNTNTFEERYRAVMDTVNTASVEGSLFYVQSEGIDKAVQRQNNCMRKSNMSYIWFYEMQIVQPNYALAEYDMTNPTMEYGPYASMDNGMCTPTAVAPKVLLPPPCYQFTGLEGKPALGPFVGGEPRTSHPFAKYRDNVWFSYPGSCFTKSFEAKDDKCREGKLFKGGACPYGTKPDGITCTYSYKVLGYIRIDDLVGITSMTNPNTGVAYRDKVDHCKAGQFEYDFEKDEAGIPFWDNPLDEDANANRTQYMIGYYQTMVSKGEGVFTNMKPLPTEEELAKNNPPCWENTKRCYDAPHGCKRKLLAQVCTICNTPSPECIVKPANAPPFPVLVKATPAPVPTDAKGKPVPLPQVDANGNIVAATGGGQTLVVSTWISGAVTIFVVLAMA